ncbi:DUF3293 domain-containing protein [Dyella sp. A6]|uniref:DUF3293 domain-containing protein n=1 Tax=Dyella aluminiiresistens TaxID=3069105 RepID=UPI002E779B50|nr:DUF3293 domain-containing protein [Dyella sp. A6]
MDETLLAAYRATAYRVRLARGGCATLRVDFVPPTALRSCIGHRTWSFITACNPGSRPQPAAVNRRAQRSLLDAVRQLPETVSVHAACGSGNDGWREPSLFVVGPERSTMDTLARRYGQNAYLHGHGTLPAQLRLLHG